MIANLIGGFVSIIIGVSLLGPVSSEINTVAASTNATGAECLTVEQAGCENMALYVSSGWGATVLKMVPGFFSLGILGIGIAITYSSLRQAGIV